jgi:hypothetical protein
VTHDVQDRLAADQRVGDQGFAIQGFQLVGQVANLFVLGGLENISAVPS